MKVIIDTDPGIDDAVALGMALSNANLDILAITTTAGNVGIDQVTRNTLKILQAFDRTNVPVFKGVASSIIKHVETASWYHGVDGLGHDIVEDDLEAIDRTPLQSEHATHAINRLVNEHKNEITFIALAPLTNLALAHRLNEELSTNLKELVIMGGNYRGEGNVSLGAEFNFWFDASAAHIVVQEFVCPKILVTWELCKDECLTDAELKQFTGYDTKKSAFMKKIFDRRRKIHKDVTKHELCDPVAMAIALKRDVMTQSENLYGTVELHGEHTKGACVYDWLRSTGKSPNVCVVEGINTPAFKEMVMASVQ